MALQTGGGAGGEPAGVPGYLSYLPVAWLCVTMLLSVRWLVTAWPLLSDYSLPSDVVLYFEIAMAADAVTILWGLYVLALAWNRSHRFPRHFTVWQVAQILWTLAGQAWIFLLPDFVPTASSLAIAAIHVAVGLACIWLVRREPKSSALYANAETARPPVVISILLAILGIVLGGAVGFGIGLVAGAAIAEITDMSCFEGACGFFAFFIGLAGLLAGAVGGGVFAVWRANRRPRAPAVS